MKENQNREELLRTYKDLICKRKTHINQIIQTLKQQNCDTLDFEIGNKHIYLNQRAMKA